MREITPGIIKQHRKTYLELKNNGRLSQLTAIHWVQVVHRLKAAYYYPNPFILAHLLHISYFQSDLPDAAPRGSSGWHMEMLGIHLYRHYIPDRVSTRTTITPYATRNTTLAHFLLGYYPNPCAVIEPTQSP